MRIGDLVADRFAVQRAIGSGGMGSVFLAADTLEGGLVAVKVLDLASEGAVERFRREARALSELSHPGIVRYIAHGETVERQPFLVMELLEGEDLGRRLARGGLSLEESLLLLRRAANALAFAHSRGVVHRDVKPSNLFLVGGAVGEVKVLDFGIARTHLQTEGLTQTGAMLGTVGYMAPEQAMGARDVDARADVFALGCVLFECLAGRAAFAGEHAVAILAKVLTEEAPRVGEFCPGLGAAADALVARMLAKQPADRPADAAALLRELDALESGGESFRLPASSARSSHLGHGERRVIAVVLGEPAGGGAVLPTVTPEQVTAETEAARATALRYGADVHVLAGGAMVFVISDKAAASDLAARAASLALALARALPSLRLVVATGHAQTTGRLPVGEAIDRAAAILRAPSAPWHGPLLDDVTLALVGARCVVREEEGFHLLVGEAWDVELARLLMGKPTPTIGREKELGLLDATLAECVEDSVARVVLVTASPGTGKSRLGSEFISQVRRSDRARVLVARGEATGSGRLVRDLAWCAAGLREGGTLGARQEAWRKYLRALMPGPEGEHVADFLGEAIGVPSPGSSTPELIAARNDPRIMARRVRDAIPAWLAAECARRSLVLFLEDLHWADSGSVSYIEETLSRLSACPLLVVALARPDARETFPKLWERPDAQEIKLGGLTRRSAERLALGALGDGADPALVTRIVNQAGGNAFYLEELIRAAAEGRDDLPETVTAMAAFRLERLDAGARRVLRAGSIFGERFPTTGVAELLGADPSVLTVLASLADQEVIDRIPEGRFSGEQEYAFRHALLRDAAYAMLTPPDRVGGHAIAGEWLAVREEAEPLAIAEHFEKAELPEKAAKWWATEASLTVGRRRGMPLHRLVAKALACGASGRDRGICLALSAYIATGGGDVGRAIDAGREAMSLLPATTREWFFGVGAIAAGAHMASRPELAREVFAVVSALDPVPAATGPMAWALMCGVQSAVMHDDQDLAVRFLALIRDAGDHARLGDGGVDPIFLGHEAVAQCYVEMHARDSVGAALRVLEDAPKQFGRGGDVWSRSYAHIFRAAASFEAGALESAISTLERGARFYDRPGNELAGNMALAYWAWALAANGRTDADEIVRPALTSTSPANRALAGLVLTQLRVDRGDAEGGAQALAPLMLDTEPMPPFFRRTALALQARVSLLRGAAEEAALLATRAAVGLKGSCAAPYFRSLVLLTHAECLHAAGRSEDAAAAIGTAADRLLRNAAEIEGEANRQRYLADLPHNRRTIELAGEWLGTR